MVSLPSLDDFRWLVSPDASPYLDRAAADKAQLVRLTQALRQELSPERTHLVLEQAVLRDRGREKFQRAAQMFFTPTLLEQATDERIAMYKAQRFPPGEVVVDFCCGIGGDALGLASRGPTLGVDRDPVAALLAVANHQVYGRTHFSSRLAEATDFVTDLSDAWHIDPDRRVQGHRSTQLEFLEPSTEVLESLFRRQANGAVKLASATELPAHWLPGMEREWIESRGECRQQVAWFGSRALSPGAHRATVVQSDGSAASIAGQPRESSVVANAIARFIFEPHPAVLAAKLAGNVSEQHQLSFVGERVAYLTGDHSVVSPLLSCFEVLEVLPFDLRKLRAAFAARNVGRLEIKARGVDIDPITLRKKLRPRGDHELTLLIAGPQSNVRAILARRLS